MSGEGLRYCRGRVKRALDLTLALPALVFLSPVIGVLAVCVLATMGPPVLFRHERAGLGGRPFRLIKFRSMRPGGSGALPITGRGDPRITPLGRFLRLTKLDELPQLLNIVGGQMSIVGPRPEVPRYVAGYSPSERRVLEVRPGLTDPASLAYRNEESILGSVPDGDREAFYVREVLPRKLALNLDYIDQASLGKDLGLILKTFAAVILKARA